jgi:hypothetical protein
LENEIICVGVQSTKIENPSHSTPNNRLHLTAFGAVRGGHSQEKSDFSQSCLAKIGGR